MEWFLSQYNVPLSRMERQLVHDLYRLPYGAFLRMLVSNTLREYHLLDSETTALYLPNHKNIQPFSWEESGNVRAVFQSGSIGLGNDTSRLTDAHWRSLNAITRV